MVSTCTCTLVMSGTASIGSWVERVPARHDDEQGRDQHERPVLETEVDQAAQHLSASSASDGLGELGLQDEAALGHDDVAGLHAGQDLGEALEAVPDLDEAALEDAWRDLHEQRSGAASSVCSAACGTTRMAWPRPAASGRRRGPRTNMPGLQLLGRVLHGRAHPDGARGRIERAAHEVDAPLERLLRVGLGRGS